VDEHQPVQLLIPFPFGMLGQEANNLAFKPVSPLGRDDRTVGETGREGAFGTFVFVLEFC
jgi:hypothetical protein